ncbi:MAG: polymorphic toxin-type HINT domain-containing protein [Phycisphaeraceae bacterium]
MLGNSFTAGTGVVTGVAADGGLLTTDIATLAVGDVVLTNDELIPGGDPHYALVTGVSHRTVYALHHVSYITDAGESETLETTDNHEFYARRLTGQAGWLKAQDLQPGDQLLTPDGTWATVTNNTLQLAPAGITVYNLTVSDGSTYYVDDGQGDASAVWVHNKSACKLAKNLINAGIARADDTIPHHLVARGLFKNRLRDGGFDAALENQRILQKYEIDLDDAVNGVFLDISIHKVERTAYILEVSKRLKIADRTGEREEVIAALKKIGEDLQSGVLKL